MIETENHSPEWYQIAAELTCDEILSRDAEVRRKEARRRVRRNEIEAEYQAMASYAESYHQLNKEEVIEKLRTADERDFRLLELAMKVKEEKERAG